MLFFTYQENTWYPNVKQFSLNQFTGHQIGFTPCRHSLKWLFNLHCFDMGWNRQHIYVSMHKTPSVVSYLCLLSTIQCSWLAAVNSAGWQRVINSWCNYKNSWHCNIITCCHYHYSLLFLIPKNSFKATARCKWWSVKPEKLGAMVLRRTCKVLACLTRMHGFETSGKYE